MRKPATRAHGFTLVEVLVALLIMSILAAMGWQGVDGMIRARDISQETAERTLRLTTVVGQWEQDLASLYDSAIVPALQFDGAALRLTRTTPDGAQVVVWTLREGVWRRWASAIVRRAFELQQAWLMSQQLIGNEDHQVRLLDGASEWQVYFYRGNAWTNAQSSGDVVAAPSPALAASGVVVPRAALPSGVRLVINLGERRLTRDVMLGPTQS
jgi:general secretion pathway protein J